MDRLICLDTETTGLEVKEGHRIIEIGCVEIIDRQLTNNTFHVYINPARLVDEGAFKVHGISNEFLQDKPFFEDIVSDFLAFIKGATLVIHNAAFDLGFLNAECRQLIKAFTAIESQNEIIDSLKLAQKKHRGQKNNLDALCKRYGIDNSNRTLHGALLDAEILAEVYLAMTGGQLSLFSAESMENTNDNATNNNIEGFMPTENKRSVGRVIYADEKELIAHQKFMQKFEE